MRRQKVVASPFASANVVVRLKRFDAQIDNFARLLYTSDCSKSRETSDKYTIDQWSIRPRRGEFPTCSKTKNKTRQILSLNLRKLSSLPIFRRTEGERDGRGGVRLPAKLHANKALQKILFRWVCTRAHVNGVYYTR